MKFVVLAISLFALVAKSRQSITDMEACASEVGGSKGGNNPLSPGNPEYECLNACIMRKKGEIKNGKVDPAAAFNQYKKTSRLPLAALKDKVNVCAEKANKETTACNVAKVLANCMTK